jgi:cobalamin biosynthesis protein CobD/CbiB
MAAALLNAYLLDWLFGDPRRGHPVAGFGRIASALERLLWRPSRAAGALYVATLVGCTALATAAVDRVLRRQPYTRLAWRSIVVWAMLGGRSLKRIALRLAGQVHAGDAVAARSLAHALRPARAACVHPSFTEPEAALRAVGTKVVRVRSTVTRGASIRAGSRTTRSWS